MELNPNHPVTKKVHDHWHKIAALLMLKFNQTDVEITLEDLDLLGDNEKAVLMDERGGKCFIRIVSMAEGERLAREEGGLPV